LLQEQLGERLDLPASAITEAVIDEHLRPRGVPEATLAPLHELFQTCDLVRYAPMKSSQELAAVIPKLEGVLRDLKELKA
jgi:predicted anti-sigma-YlaC factor YlaD